VRRWKERERERRQIRRGCASKGEAQGLLRVAANVKRDCHFASRSDCDCTPISASITTVRFDVRQLTRSHDGERGERLNGNVMKRRRRR
jgi:hypothetical protein